MDTPWACQGENDGGSSDTPYLLEPMSRFGGIALKLQVVCPQNGAAVLKGIRVLIPRDVPWDAIVFVA